jgi:hypothetical protein
MASVFHDRAYENVEGGARHVRSASEAGQAGRDVSEVDEAHALDLVRRSIATLELDLSGLVVVTGVAGKYEQLAAAAAALAGAKWVLGVCRDPPRRVRAIGAPPCELPFAKLANAAERIEIVSRLDSPAWNGVDILVSSPELTPIARPVVELLPPTAVIALMAAPWEVGPHAVDIDACDKVGIKVAAPNLHHPFIGQLPELAQLCRRLIEDAGLDLTGAKIAVLCDTPFAPFIERALAGAGADIRTFPHPLLLTRNDWDAIVVALHPSERSSMDINGLAAIADNAPDALLLQFSGHIDRVAARYFGLRLWPQKRPVRGHLGQVESLGLAPMIRRLIAGLKAAEMARRGVPGGPESIGIVVRGGAIA